MESDRCWQKKGQGWSIGGMDLRMLDTLYAAAISRILSVYSLHDFTGFEGAFNQTSASAENKKPVKCKFHKNVINFKHKTMRTP